MRIFARRHESPHVFLPNAPTSRTIRRPRRFRHARSSRHLPIQFSEESNRVNAKRMCNLAKLHHVKSALATLIFRDEGLGTFEARREFSLGEVRLLAGLDHKLTELLI